MNRVAWFQGHLISCKMILSSKRSRSMPSGSCSHHEASRKIMGVAADKREGLMPPAVLQPPLLPWDCTSRRDELFLPCQELNTVSGHGRIVCFTRNWCSTVPLRYRDCIWTSIFSLFRHYSEYWRLHKSTLYFYDWVKCTIHGSPLMSEH